MPVLQASFSHSGNPSCLCRGFLGEEKVKWEWEGSCSPCACVIPIKQNQTRARIFWSQFLILPGTSGICSQNKNGKSGTAHVLIYHIIQIRICILKTRKGIVSSSRYSDYYPTFDFFKTTFLLAVQVSKIIIYTIW